MISLFTSSIDALGMCFTSPKLGPFPFFYVHIVCITIDINLHTHIASIKSQAQ